MRTLIVDKKMGTARMRESEMRKRVQGFCQGSIVVFIKHRIITSDTNEGTITSSGIMREEVGSKEGCIFQIRG
jgi:hypothetical protein